MYVTADLFVPFGNKFRNKISQTHSPEHYGDRKEYSEDNFLPKCPALQGQFTTEAFELADPVEDLEDAWHHDARQRETKPIEIPMLVEGVEVVA